MFCGTFYWFRHDATFGNPHWTNIPDDRYGAEAWPAGLLLIDTIHTGRQLYAELKRHGDAVRRWIALHDTEAFAVWDELLEEPGLWPALWRWLRDRPEWRAAYVSRESYGLTILERARCEL
jgi:hypothetical protein